MSHPTATALDYGVFHFRKTYDASERMGIEGPRSGAAPPATLPVLVSADNRYRLYVNGALVSLGPTRGDLLHWRYERVDLAPYLRPGANVVGATVWNMGAHRPAAQVTHSTAFWLQAVDTAGAPLSEHPLNTDTSWRVHHDLAYSPELNEEVTRRTYAVVGPTDVVDAARHPWGWQTGEEHPGRAAWVPAAAGPLAKGYGGGTDGGRYLVPSRQAPQRSDESTWGRVRRMTGDTSRLYALALTEDGGLDSVIVGGFNKVTFLFDHGALTTGYPRLDIWGGEATVNVTYAEALVDAAGEKGHRDSIRGRNIVGLTDRYLPDGSQQTFEPLWWRTWRYIQVEVETGPDPVQLSGFAARRTGYPLVQRATLTTELPWLRDIWETGWRTQALCAHETFVDCPYYEQLQYVGDTRIQALVTLYQTGDATLVRRAIQDFADSRLPDGLTQSRYPTDRLQVIPPYSLAWVAMVHDYHLHVPDEAFVREQLDGVAAVLAWHRRHLNARGLMGRTPWWNFVDWAADWPWDSDARQGGVPPQLADGSSAVLTLQYAYTLGLAAKLYATLGHDAEAAAYRAEGRELLLNVEASLRPGTGLIPDAPLLDSYSQHAQVMQLLARLTLGEGVREGFGVGDLRRTLLNPDITATTLYYDFYKFEALRLAGGEAADEYLQLLRPWRTMLDLGLSTFAERPEPTRSDCHAWSASPNYHLLSLVGGITPASPGFRTVTIAPRLGQLRQFSATMPHPAGEIDVRYERVGETGLRAEVTLPAGVTGVLRWGSEERALGSGPTVVTLGAG